MVCRIFVHPGVLVIAIVVSVQIWFARRYNSLKIWSISSIQHIFEIVNKLHILSSSWRKNRFSVNHIFSFLICTWRIHVLQFNMIIIKILDNSYIVPTCLNIIHWLWLLRSVILISRIWLLVYNHSLNTIFINCGRMSSNISRIGRSSIIHTVYHWFHSYTSACWLRVIHIPLLLKLSFKNWLISSSGWHILLRHWRSSSLIIYFRKLSWVTYTVRI